MVILDMANTVSCLLVLFLYAEVVSIRHENTLKEGKNHLIQKRDKVSVWWGLVCNK